MLLLLDYRHCSKEEFTCGNGQCIPLTLRCDAYFDCFDETDELNCESCSPSAFHCDYIRCFPNKIVCDNYHDCTDGSDEQPCEKPDMRSCVHWWQSGYKESGTYILSDVISGKTMKVICGFDHISSANEVLTVFLNMDILEWNGKLAIYNTYINDKPIDLTMDVYFISDGKANCTQEVIQSCNPVLQTVSMFDDPDFQHSYSHCICLIVTLVISWKPDISSVEYCNTLKQLNDDEIEDLLLFKYQYTTLHRTLVWKNTSVNYENIQLNIGNVTCIEGLCQRNR
ncbi:uncharacterized protein LOC132746738 [Ruditapes philippinarum]|uniref:uncharacterized protein LOC132746738 n=1 Tax=Ruditapes philippinarum TaxID=129788 RepID=UPI00295C2E13|nr:uncharacterized protein LOC132746738 [Ruditapes philippinarum]